MDTHTIFTTTEARASARRTRDHLLDLWALDRKPALLAIRDAALAQLAAIDGIFGVRYMARETANLASYACDQARATLDLLNEMHGNMLAEADEAGIAHDMMELDLLPLQLVASLWMARSEARERRAS